MRHWVFWTSGRRTITLSSTSFNNGSQEKNRVARGFATSSTPIDADTAVVHPLDSPRLMARMQGGRVAHWKREIQGRTNCPSGRNECGCVWLRHIGLLFEKSTYASVAMTVARVSASRVGWSCERGMTREHVPGVFTTRPWTITINMLCRYRQDSTAIFLPALMFFVFSRSFVRASRLFMDSKLLHTF